MFTAIFQTRSLVLTAALLLGTATANAQTTPKPPTKTESTKTTLRIPGNLQKSRNFHDWKSYCYFRRYHCYGYYNAASRLWFYWYQPFNRYLPISYMSTYPPVNIGQIPVPAIPSTGSSGDSGPSLPPDASAIPDSPSSKKGSKGTKTTPSDDE